MNVKIEGLNELNALLKGMPKLVEKTLDTTLKTVGLDLQGKAQAITPTDTADLQGSAFTESGAYGDVSTNTSSDSHPKSARLPHDKAGKLEVIVGFSEPYALRIHEGVGFNHPRGGEAKFLETPYKANQSRYIKLIGDAIKREVDKK